MLFVRDIVAIAKVKFAPEVATIYLNLYTYDHLIKA